MKSVWLCLGLFILSAPCKSQTDFKQSNDNKVWLDPAIDISGRTQSVVVWFDDQLLRDGSSFMSYIETLKGAKRSELRSKVINDLKRRSNRSFSKIANELKAFVERGNITDLKQHWIVNGFSCIVKEDGIADMLKLEGISKIFLKKEKSTSSNQPLGPTYLENIPPSRFRIDSVESYPWNIEKIKAVEVWKTYGITGKGSLNVVHDSGFKLDIPPLAESIYVNQDEIPGNQIDDDNNGYIDDYHGFDFDGQSPQVNKPFIRRATIIHGNACASMISGTFATNSNVAIGIAPGSKWAPVIGAANIEQSVEWAIEQGADTYSMSFSQPDLGEFRSHWRKVMEQGTLCGIIFISGAGNFASNRNYAPVPVQMRNPEDIPNAVLGVAGVGQNSERPDFSSQGPVVWQTDHYKDGQVNKPDFTTLNYQIPCLDPDGYVTNVANGNSLAGPHMAGIVSLMLSANPELLPWEVKEILILAAEDIADKGFDFQTGYGFVNAYDAVTEALNWKK